MQADLCDTPFGQFALARIPVDRTGTLRAWDGADLLLLDAVAALPKDDTRRVLIIGDNFGALSVALAGPSTGLLSDSIVAEHAISRNRRTSGSTQPLPVLSSAITGPELAQELGGPVDLVVWNVGKSTDMLTHLAGLLSAVSHAGTIVFAAGMDKHLPPRTGDVLRAHGDLTTHPGRKKAHLFELRVRPGASAFDGVARAHLLPVHLPEHNLDVAAWPGVFSADRFDLGTRLLADEAAALEEILPDAREIVDLGCGTGILGMLALRALPTATVTFLDESSHAVASARHNVELNLATLGTNAIERSRFIRSHVFDDAELPEIDLVLCNPPFHHANAMSDAVAWQMFVESQRVLRPGGEIWVVANRHLGYHEKLSRIFEATALVASHPKFVIIAGRS